MNISMKMREYIPLLIKKSDEYKPYESKVDNSKRVSVKQHLSLLTPHSHALINEYKNEPGE